MKKKILITGGTGYIGSCFISLYHNQFEIYSLDKSKPKFLENIKKITYKNCNLLNRKKLEKIVSKVKPDVVIHLAAESTVNEKIKWNNYYKNNIEATKNLVYVMNKFKVKRLIFSSTASVYKEKKTKISEKHKLEPSSKYGKSKLIAEKIIKNNKNINYIILRFFNVCSAIRKPLIGEFHNPETHLIPVSITKAFNEQTIKIFGSNYNTRDGTCERDYIHVNDICTAIKNSALLLVRENKNHLLNIGNGKTISNLKILKTIKRISKKNIKYEFIGRRSGDQPRLFCNITKAKKTINWNPKNSYIKKIILDEIFWNKYLLRKKLKRKLLNV